MGHITLKRNNKWNRFAVILPKKGVRAIIENFAFRISPRQEVPGRLLHRPGFGRRALLLWTRKGRVEGAMAQLLVEQRGGTLTAGGHQPSQAALLRLALGHGSTAYVGMTAAQSVPLASVLEQCVIRVNPTPSECQHPGIVRRGHTFKRAINQISGTGHIRRGPEMPRHTAFD